jgi:hypothetical protein
LFRIRRIYDATLPINREALSRVQDILRSQFPLYSEKEIAKLPEQLRNPLKYRFRSILFVAQGFRRDVQGFALIFHDPDLRFCFIDFLSTGEKKMGTGVGAALYERVREEALALGTMGLFYECLPDDPDLSRNPAIRKENAERLAFFERYGARPVAGTAFETPVAPGGDNPPYLLFDDLGQGIALRRETARTIVRAVLERKYAHLVTWDYIERFV